MLRKQTRKKKQKNDSNLQDYFHTNAVYPKIQSIFRALYLFVITNDCHRYMTSKRKMLLVSFERGRTKFSSPPMYYSDAIKIHFNLTGT